jgi:hypothetical protein
MSPLMLLALLLLALTLSIAGGAITGLRLAGKDLGPRLAAMMGAFYGPTAAVPAALLGLTALALLR